MKENVDAHFAKEIGLLSRCRLRSFVRLRGRRSFALCFERSVFAGRRTRAETSQWGGRTTKDSNETRDRRQNSAREFLLNCTHCYLQNLIKVLTGPMYFGSQWSQLRADLNSRVLQSPTDDGISYFLPRHLLQTISSILGAFFVRSPEERARELAKFIGRVQCLICPLGAGDCRHLHLRQSH